MLLFIGKVSKNLLEYQIFNTLTTIFLMKRRWESSLLFPTLSFPEAASPLLKRQLSITNNFVS